MTRQRFQVELAPRSSADALCRDVGCRSGRIDDARLPISDRVPDQARGSATCASAERAALRRAACARVHVANRLRVDGVDSASDAIVLAPANAGRPRRRHADLDGASLVRAMRRRPRARRPLRDLAARCGFEPARPLSRRWMSSARRDAADGDAGPSPTQRVAGDRFAAGSACIVATAHRRRPSAQVPAAARLAVVAGRRLLSARCLPIASPAQAGPERSAIGPSARRRCRVRGRLDGDRACSPSVLPSGGAGLRFRRREALPRHHVRLPDERPRLRADQGHARVARPRRGAVAGRGGRDRLQHLHDPREARPALRRAPRAGRAR